MISRYRSARYQNGAPFNGNLFQSQCLILISKPAPVKAVLNYLGFEVGPLRLPLVPCPIEDANASSGRWTAIMKNKATVTGEVRPDY